MYSSILGGLVTLLLLLTTVGIVYFFFKSGILFGRFRQEGLPEVRSGDPVPYKISNELKELDIPEEKLEQVTYKINNLVNEEVEKKSQKVREEMHKVVEARDVQVKQTQEKYEAVQKDFQKLGKQKKQTEAVVRSMAKGMIVTNDEGVVIFVNPVAAKMMNVAPEEIIGKPIATVEGDHAISMVPDEEAEEKMILPSSKKNEYIKDVIKESMAVIENESGQTKGMVSILTGTTKKRQANEFKEEFLANITHELRAPLVCIIKSLAAIQDSVEKAGDEEKNFLSVAVRNAEKLEKMVNNILDLSKMESGKLALKIDVVTAKSLIDEVRNSFKAWAEGKEIEIKESIESGDPLLIEGDADRLRQVLTNLVSNALKFTPRGGVVTIDAKLEKGLVPKQEMPEDFVQIGVRDSGPGLSGQDKSNMFQKFAKGSAVATAGEQGTGLGLSIAKQIVELHRGRIWVESEEGKGAYFAFAIPKKHPKLTANDFITSAK